MADKIPLPLLIHYEQGFINFDKYEVFEIKKIFCKVKVINKKQLIVKTRDGKRIRFNSNSCRKARWVNKTVKSSMGTYLDRLLMLGVKPGMFMLLEYSIGRMKASTSLGENHRRHYIVTIYEPNKLQNGKKMKAILEIQAGEGGLDASQFAKQLSQMYQKYIAAKVAGYKATQIQTIGINKFLITCETT